MSEVSRADTTTTTRPRRSAPLTIVPKTVWRVGRSPWIGDPRIGGRGSRG